MFFSANCLSIYQVLTNLHVILGQGSPQTVASNTVALLLLLLAKRPAEEKIIFFIIIVANRMREKGEEYLRTYWLFSNFYYQEETQTT